MTVSRAMMRAAAGVGGGWDLSKLSLIGDGGSFPLNANYMISFGLSSDGTKLYIGKIGSGSSNRYYIYQYALSTPWDTTTASYTSSFDASSQMGHDRMFNMFFKPDGTELYIRYSDITTSRNIAQYTLSTAWDITSASYSGGYFLSYSVVGSYAGQIFVGDSGSKLFAISYDTGRVHQYDLSTPWDITTATYDDESPALTHESGTEHGVWFNDNGLKMYVLIDNKIGQYTLSTQWDVTTATYDSVIADITHINNYPCAFLIGKKGTRLYAGHYSGSEADTLAEYSM